MNAISRSGKVRTEKYPLYLIIQQVLETWYEQFQWSDEGKSQSLVHTVINETRQRLDNLFNTLGYEEKGTGIAK